MSSASDACVRELKTSTVLCLGPQVSVRQVIETSIDRGTVTSLGGELKHSKCLSALVNSGENEFLLLIKDVCESFYKRNKTGVSTLVSYICFLLDNLRGVESTHLDEVLTLLTASYERSVQSLRLQCPQCSGPCRSCAESALTTQETRALERKAEKDMSILDTGDDEDDVGWFFSDDVAPSSVHSSRPSAPPTTPPPCTAGATVEAKSFIWKGLDHCLSWEFASPIGVDADDQVSLPMKVALSAVTHLFAQDLRTPETSPPAADRKPSLLERLSFEKIQGRNIADVEVLEDTIIEFCESVAVKTDKPGLRALHVAAQGSRVYASYHQALQRQQERAAAISSQVQGLHRVAVVDLAVCVDDSSTAQLRASGQGGSQQADGLAHHVTSVHRPSSPQGAANTIRQLNDGASYIERALQHLLELDVQVLLCPYSVHLKLLDACFENGICVAPLSTDKLHIMARLTGADVMEDILDLHPECLGCRGAWMAGGVLTRSRYVCVTARDCVRRVQSDDSDGGHNSQLNVMLLIQVKGSSDEGESDNDSCSETLPKFKPYANSSMDIKQPERRHVSVLIRCPTVVMGDLLADRVSKSVSRIEAVSREATRCCDVVRTCPQCSLQQPSCGCLQRKLVPGGGLVELICAAFIEETRNESSAEELPAVMYADKLTQALQDFSCKISTNNGQTPEQSMCRWSACLREITASFGRWSECSTEPVSVADYLASLSTEQLTHLPRPVVLDGDDKEPVLDVALLKMECMKAACFAVGAILNTSHIITLS